VIACPICESPPACKSHGCISCPASGFITLEGGATVEDGIPTPEECLGWVELAVAALIVLLVIAMAFMPSISAVVLGWLRPFVH
jgi:hypothetical protein